MLRKFCGTGGMVVAFGGGRAPSHLVACSWTMPSVLFPQANKHNFRYKDWGVVLSCNQVESLTAVLIR